MSTLHQLITNLIQNFQFAEAHQTLDREDVKLNSQEYQDLANQANKALKRHPNNLSTYSIKKILKSAGNKAKLLGTGIKTPVFIPKPIPKVEIIKNETEPAPKYSENPKINNLILNYFYNSFQNVDLIVCVVVLTTLLYVLQVNFLSMYQV